MSCPLPVTDVLYHAAACPHPDPLPQAGEGVDDARLRRAFYSQGRGGVLGEVDQVGREQLARFATLAEAATAVGPSP